MFGGVWLDQYGGVSTVCADVGVLRDNTLAFQNCQNQQQGKAHGSAAHEAGERHSRGLFLMQWQ